MPFDSCGYTLEAEPLWEARRMGATAAVFFVDWHGSRNEPCRAKAGTQPPLGREVAQAQKALSPAFRRMSTSNQNPGEDSGCGFGASKHVMGKLLNIVSPVGCVTKGWPRPIRSFGPKLVMDICWVSLELPCGLIYLGGPRKKDTLRVGECSFRSCLRLG